MATAESLRNRVSVELTNSLPSALTPEVRQLILQFYYAEQRLDASRVSARGRVSADGLTFFAERSTAAVATGDGDEEDEDVYCCVLGSTRLDAACGGGAGGEAIWSVSMSKLTGALFSIGVAHPNALGSSGKSILQIVQNTHAPATASGASAAAAVPLPRPVPTTDVAPLLARTHEQLERGYGTGSKHPRIAAKGGDIDLTNPNAKSPNNKSNAKKQKSPIKQTAAAAAAAAAANGNGDTDGSADPPPPYPCWVYTPIARTKTAGLTTKPQFYGPQHINPALNLAAHMTAPDSMAAAAATATAADAKSAPANGAKKGGAGGVVVPTFDPRTDWRWFVSCDFERNAIAFYESGSSLGAAFVLPPSTPLRECVPFATVSGTGIRLTFEFDMIPPPHVAVSVKPVYAPPTGDDRPVRKQFESNKPAAGASEAGANGGAANKKTKVKGGTWKPKPASAATTDDATPAAAAATVVLPPPTGNPIADKQARREAYFAATQQQKQQNGGAAGADTVVSASTSALASVGALGIPVAAGAKKPFQRAGKPPPSRHAQQKQAAAAAAAKKSERRQPSAADKARKSAAHALVQLHPGLWISSLVAANDEPQLRACGITHVLTCCAERAPKHYPNITYHHHGFADDPDVELTDFLTPCMKVIDSALVTDSKSDTPNNVLVHCIAGVSRSASICIAAIMRFTGEPFTAVLPRVKALRPMINPNAGFTRQLVKLSKVLIRERLTSGYAPLPKPATAADSKQSGNKHSKQ